MPYQQFLTGGKHIVVWSRQNYMI